MSRFKVGDKVKVRKDLVPLKNYGSNMKGLSLHYIDSQDFALGREFVIEDITGEGNYYLKDSVSIWSDNMLEDPVFLEEKVTVTIYTDELNQKTTEYHAYYNLEDGEKFFWDKINRLGVTHSDLRRDVQYFRNGQLVNSIVMRPSND